MHERKRKRKTSTAQFIYISQVLPFKLTSEEPNIVEKRDKMQLIPRQPEKIWTLAMRMLLCGLIDIIPPFRSTYNNHCGRDKVDSEQRDIHTGEAIAHNLVESPSPVSRSSSGGFSIRRKSSKRESSVVRKTVTVTASHQILGGDRIQETPSQLQSVLEEDLVLSRSMTNRSMITTATESNYYKIVIDSTPNYSYGF